ncbi:MAG: MarR family transcriptional regulator [Erysipelotrichaceae bacterium]|uniref:MarR family transcriptional regulator n=1 Tax=Copranaerobaculum intestinale TaxID=2692629 RepID=A0A6N8U7X6_9FIRM|nr:MarR family transcriptional regulator [Copranaerobaculum intestinale]MBS6373360.1 MarR family transcriptional regulator [Erysipelotrichaceae bacterium]MXQ73635.1 MarR family transcriptional regulator [Copranaerobaculum intestinale]
MKTPFNFVMFKTYHAQRNHIRMNMTDHGLSPGQPKILRYLNTHEDCMLKDIAANCDVEPATVSRILGNLEETGMLTKTVGTQDKRSLRLAITKKGKEALAWWNIHCQEVDELSLKGFSEEERCEFEKYLDRMYFNLSGRHLE